MVACRKYPTIAICVVSCCVFIAATSVAQDAWMPADIDKPELYDPAMKIHEFAFSPDSKTLIVGGMRKGASLVLFTGELLYWRIGTEDEIRHRRISEAIYQVAAAPDGNRIAATAGSLQLWSGKGEYEKTLRGHAMLPGNISFSADSRLIASGGDRLEFFDVEKGTVVWSIDDYGAVGAVVFGPQASDCAAVQHNGPRAISIFHVDRKTKSTLDRHDHRLGPIVWLNAKTLASGDEKGHLLFWDVASGGVSRTIDAHERAVQMLAISADGTTIATGDSASLKLWNVSSGKLIATLAADGQPAFSSDGKWLAARQGDKIALWPRAAPTTEKGP